MYISQTKYISSVSNHNEKIFIKSRNGKIGSSFDYQGSYKYTFVVFLIRNEYYLTMYENAHKDFSILGIYKTEKDLDKEYYLEP